jgi:3-methyladenine DNA glycosylase AlkD
VRSLQSAARGVSPSLLLDVAQRLLRDENLEARWFAFRILEWTVGPEPERTWQLLRSAARAAGDWITVDALAHPVARGILSEPFRWAEIEQLVFSPSRWERRLVGSTIATLPFVDRRAGRTPDYARRALPVLADLIGDAEPDVQKALAWAYRSVAMVDAEAATRALAAESERATRSGDGNRAWVIRDALGKLDPEAAARLRADLAGIRRRPGTPSTSRAAETAARFSTASADFASNQTNVR